MLTFKTSLDILKSPKTLAFRASVGLRPPTSHRKGYFQAKNAKTVEWARLKGLLFGFQVGKIGPSQTPRHAASSDQRPLIGCLGKVICGNVARKVGTPLRCCPPAAGPLNQSRQRLHALLVLIRQRFHGLRVLFVHLPIPVLRSRPHLLQASLYQAALCNADAKAKKHASGVHPKLPQSILRTVLTKR